MRTAGEALPSGMRARRPEPADRRTFAHVRKHSKPVGVVRYARISSQEAGERMMALRRWERKQAKDPRKKNAAVGHIGLEVYEALCRAASQGKGRIDLISYAYLATRIRRARSAVIAAVKRLRKTGWLWWIRQFQETGEQGVRGPQVQQAPNAYLLVAPRDELLKLGIRFGPAPLPVEQEWAREQADKAYAQMAKDDVRLQVSPLGEALGKLGAAVDARQAAAERESSQRSHS